MSAFDTAAAAMMTAQFTAFGESVLFTRPGFAPVTVTCIWTDNPDPQLAAHCEVRTSAFTVQPVKRDTITRGGKVYEICRDPNDPECQIPVLGTVKLHLRFKENA